MKRSQKASFVSPRSSKITEAKEKERRKGKSEEKERRRREKSNGSTLFGQKDAKGQVYLAVVFSNNPARYIFQYFYFILMNLFYFR